MFFKSFSTFYLILLSTSVKGLQSEGERQELSEIHRIVIGHVLEQANKPISFNLQKPVSPFIGRVGELSELKWTLADNQAIVITGVKGVGKTELAKKFAFDLKHDNESSVIFLDASTNSDLAANFKELAYYIGIKLEGKDPLSIVRETINFLKERKTLLILDNSENDNILVNVLPNMIGKSKNIHVLITSRTEEWYEPYKNIHISEFTEEESKHFLQENLNPKVPFEIPEEKVEKVASLVGFLPQNLQQVVKFIEEHVRIYPKKSLDDFIQDLEKQGIVEFQVTFRPPSEAELEDLLSKALSAEAKEFKNKIEDTAVDTWGVVKDGTVQGFHVVADFSKKTYEEELKPAANKVANTAKKVADDIYNFFKSI